LGLIERIVNGASIYFVEYGHQYTLCSVGSLDGKKQKSMMSITHAYKWVGNMASGLVDG
jgi:hypothetical protein